MRGGARQGAGRRPSPNPMKVMTLYVPADIFRKAQALRKAGVKVNHELAFEIQRLYHLCLVPDLDD